MESALNIELERRDCGLKGCRGSFSVLPSDPQRGCTQRCEDTLKGMSKKCAVKKRQQQDFQTKPREYGTQAHGELKKASKKGKNETVNDQGFARVSSETLKILSAGRRQEIDPPRSERKKRTAVVNTIKTIKPSVTESDPRERIKIEKMKIENKGNGMPENEKTDLEKSQHEGEGEIQLSDLNQLSTELRQEGSNSISRLNESTNLLIGYAKQLAKPPRTDEDGESILNAPTHQILDAVRCLEAARNMMKTKLNYLKLGKEIADAK